MGMDGEGAFGDGGFSLELQVGVRIARTGWGKLFLVAAFWNLEVSGAEREQVTVTWLENGVEQSGYTYNLDDMLELQRISALRWMETELGQYLTFGWGAGLGEYEAKASLYDSGGPGWGEGDRGETYGRRLSFIWGGQLMVGMDLETGRASCGAWRIGCR